MGIGHMHEDERCSDERAENNIIARNSNGVYEGVAIGGDRLVTRGMWRHGRYPGSRFIDHLLRYQA